MSHLKPVRKLNEGERGVMLEWAANNGKAVRQRTVRLETTMFKAGTLPLNMYATSGQPTEKIMGRHTGHYCKPLIYVLNSSLICSLPYKHAKLQINMVYLLLFYMAIVI